MRGGHQIARYPSVQIAFRKEPRCIEPGGIAAGLKLVVVGLDLVGKPIVFNRANFGGQFLELFVHLAISAVQRSRQLRNLYIYMYTDLSLRSC